VQHCRHDFNAREKLKPGKFVDFYLQFSTHHKNGKDGKRFLNLSHLDKFPWLVSSDVNKD